MRDGRPRLLASLHDVSPLTLEASRAAVALLAAGGVPAAALTVLAVPFHDGRVALDEDPPTVRFLRGLADAGATVVGHGYTHRMVGAPRGWRRRAAARWFARGQGELAACDGAETRRRLDLADAIFARAGLVTCGFVPPAWLLSAEAEVAVAARSPRFCERFAGIACDGELLARRLIGWGSLTAVEARATAAWAGIQVRRRPADTRLALHPPDLARTVTRRSAVRTLAALAERLPPASYATFLDACGARRA